MYFLLIFCLLNSRALDPRINTSTSTSDRQRVSRMRRREHRRMRTMTKQTNSCSSAFSNLVPRVFGLRKAREEISLWGGEMKDRGNEVVRSPSRI